MGGNGELEAEITCPFRPMLSVFGPDGYVGSEEEDQGRASMASPISGFDSDHVGGYESLQSSSDGGPMCPLQGFCSAQTAVYGYGGRAAEPCLLGRGLCLQDLQASMAALASAELLHSSQEKCSMDLVCSDEFCMYEFKVRRCMRGRSHDWTECPFAHPGEKARRRDPRRCRYSGTACPDYRKGGACRKGDACELSHGVFECWLHPARYRTQPCKDGKACRRRICFFAHSPAQLRRGLPDSLDDDEQFHLPRPPLASSTDGKAGYFDAPFKGPPLIKSQVSAGGAGGHGIIRGVGAYGFTDKLGPQSMTGFQTDGIQDAISPFSAQGHSLLVHEHENHAWGHGHQLRGISIDDLSALLELDRNQKRTHGYFSAADGHWPVVNHSAHELRKGYGHYNSSSSHSPNLSAEANCQNYLGLPGLKGGLDQLMSPTSTLAGPHFFSPSPLSLPLSPAESPPTSPNTTFSTWNHALSPKMASIASVNPLSSDAFSQNPTKEAAHARSSTTDYLPSTDHGSSVHLPMVSAIYDGDQLDGVDGEDALQRAISIQKESAEMLMGSNQPMQAMTGLISMLKGLNFAGMDIKNRKRWPSLLQSTSLTKTHPQRPSSFLAHDSGQGLRNKKDGKLPIEEMDNLDLGWVNELVK